VSRHRIHGSLSTETLLQAGRILTRWRRDRAVLVGSLLFPIGLLILYDVVLGENVHRITGNASVYGLVPVCAVLSALFGSLGNAMSITLDRESGMLSRMWVLPIHRASALTGRLTAEAARALIGTVLITALGVIMGLRFANGWAAALVFVLIPSIVAIAFTAMVMALAVRTNARTIMVWLVSVTVALAFVNPGFTPIKNFPDWAQPFVRLQPMAPPIEAMRSLALGGPLVWPLGMTTVWALALLTVFVPLAVRGYRSAAEASA
jgi:ABC-2 type transport system permease protein